jgi:hypothetical protein
MLLSIHIVKAAGNSFREALMRAFGDRLMRDYGDWAGFDEPAANARRKERTAAMRARASELAERFDAIHGHFIADKYAGLFDDARFLAFFRDPYQQTISHYEYLLRDTDRRSDVNSEQHPEVAYFREQKPSLMDFIEAPYYRNHQSGFLGSLSLDDLAFVGISERYGESLEHFKRVFGVDLGPPLFENVNHGRAGDYEVTPEVARAVERYRPKDVELYRKALERFDLQGRVLSAPA